jgi:transglutaminase-like putative cysteine protease
MLESLVVALARAAWKRAVAAGLLMGLVATLSYSVDQASWVAGVQWWPGAWLALLGGAALAGTRWKGRRVFLYTVALIMAGAAELVGHVLPNLAQLWQAPNAWVLNLHLHAIALGQRLQAWGAAIALSQPVGDTGLFVWLLAALEWGAVAWLAWSVLRRRQVLAGCLPAAAILAINTRLSAQPWQEVLLFVVLMLALIIYVTYATQNLDWDRRGVDYPGDLGIDWGMAALGLTLGIGLLGAAAPLVAAPSGWQLLGDLLASSRQQVAATADQLFSGVKPPSGGPPEPVARTPDLTSIGSAIDQSQGTVMWVKIDEPRPADYPGAPPPPQHYWRSGLYVTYTGTGWQSLQIAPGRAAPAQANDPLPPGRYAVRQQFEIVANHGRAQFAVNRPISATAGALVGLDATDDATALLAGPASIYSVTSWVTRVSQAELRAAGTGYPAAIRSAYLQLPPSLPARVASLAAQIANGATDPYDRALRLQDYLRITYTYRLDVPPPPAGRDAVDYFLYEAPGGFCSYYASAMAVMLRTLGVPARVATGYAMGEYDQGRGAYRVAGAAAHAWVEVYFPAYGWVEFEPTAARAVFERPLGAGATPTVAPPGAGAGAPSPVSRGLAVVLGVVVTLLAAAGWAWWQLAARREPETARQRVLRLYGRMRSALSRAGLGAKPSVTADEYLQARRDDLSARPSLLAAMTEATDLYRQAAYSPHPVREAQARAAQHLWDNARPAWIEFLVRRFVKSLRRDSK